VNLDDVLHVGVWKLTGNAAVAFCLNAASVMLVSTPTFGS